MHARHPRGGEAHLAKRGPYLLGVSATAADFLLTMFMRWSRNMPRPATDWPQLSALAQRMKARPSFRTLYEREGLTESDSYHRMRQLAMRRGQRMADLARALLAAAW